MDGRMGWGGVGPSHGPSCACRSICIEKYLHLYTRIRTHTSACASVQGGGPAGLRPSSSPTADATAVTSKHAEAGGEGAYGATKEVTHRDLPSLDRGRTPGGRALPTSKRFAALSRKEDEDEDGATDAGETARARAEPAPTAAARTEAPKRAAAAPAAKRASAADDDDDDVFVSERVAPKKGADAGSELRRTAARTALLNSLKVPDLKALCKSVGFSGYSKLKKAELVRLLAAGRSRACNDHFAKADEKAKAQSSRMASFTKTEDSSEDGDGDDDDDDDDDGDGEEDDYSGNGDGSSDSGGSDDEGGGDRRGGGVGVGGGGEGDGAGGEAAQDGGDDDSADDDDGDGEEVDGELRPSNSEERRRRIAENVNRLPPAARAALAAGVVRGGRLQLPAEAAEHFADRFAHDIEQLKKDGKWLERRYSEGGRSHKDAGIGPVTAYLSEKYIRERLQAVKDITEAVVALVGKRPVGRKGVVAIVNRPGECQGRHRDSANGNARLVVSVLSRGASRWVQLTFGRGKKMFVVDEWLIEEMLDFYVMAANVRGDHFDHCGTVDMEEIGFSLVFTFEVRPHRAPSPRSGPRPSALSVRGACVQKGVDLDPGMRADLGRHELARDSADAGAPHAGPRRHAGGRGSSGGRPRRGSERPRVPCRCRAAEARHRRYRHRGRPRGEAGSAARRGAPQPDCAHGAPHLRPPPPLTLPYPSHPPTTPRPPHPPTDPPTHAFARVAVGLRRTGGRAVGGGRRCRTRSAPPVRPTVPRRPPRRPRPRRRAAGRRSTTTSAGAPVTTSGTRRLSTAARQSTSASSPIRTTRAGRSTSGRASTARRAISTGSSTSAATASSPSGSRLTPASTAA